jgi:elongation factor P
MSISVNELKPKIFFIFEGTPFVVLETHHLKMQQRRPVVQTRMRNLMNGKVLERNFAQSDTFEEADVKRQEVKFLYAHRDEFWFVYPNDPSKRFQLSQEIVGDSARFLKANTILEAITFDDKVISVSLPVKMEFTVVEAPPAIKGDTAQGGVKSVKLDTGAYVNAPLFVNEGDTIRVNTELGEYVERVDKGK